MLRVDHNINALQRDLSDMARSQIPFATSRAINETGKALVESNRRDMRRVFNAPTRWTLNAFFFYRSSKTRLWGEVRRKDVVGRKHYLEVQEKGGPRPQTGMGKLLSRRYGRGAMYVAPASGTRRNKHGNLSGGTIQKILSQTGSQFDPTNNETSASRKRKGAGSARYFVPRPGQLSPGVWERRGAKLRPVLHFLDAAPKYAKRLRFDKRLPRLADRIFPHEFGKALAEAIRTARR